ncbi:hypothetical protein DIPPA_30936 [Diplonema papillatum]|nr:hypothetical protein DIPPA_30936 [Diplonema papillatum]
MCTDWTRTWSLCRRSGLTRRRQTRVRRSSGKSLVPGSTSASRYRSNGWGTEGCKLPAAWFHVRDRSTKVWQPPMGHAAEQRLWETGRWQHLAVPYGDGKRMLHLMTAPRAERAQKWEVQRPMLTRSAHPVLVPASQGTFSGLRQVREEEVSVVRFELTAHAGAVLPGPPRAR